MIIRVVEALANEKESHDLSSKEEIEKALFGTESLQRIVTVFMRKLKMGNDDDGDDALLLAAVVENLHINLQKVVSVRLSKEKLTTYLKAQL
jgi:hypothetical protein